MSSNLNWIPLLRKVFLFSSFTETHLSLLTKKMTLVSFPKGAILFQENKPGDSLYLILSGSVRIVKKPAGFKSGALNPEDEKTIGYLNRGDVMGEMCLLAGDLHANTAIVDSTADLLVLHKKDFDNLLDKFPALAVHLSRVLSTRLAAYDKAPGTQIQPGQLFSFVSAIPARDQIVFAVNFSIAMVEQTRKKILMVMIHENPDLMMRSLGLEPTKLSSSVIREGCFEKHKKFDAIVGVHPSGLEVVCFTPKNFFESLRNVLFPFLAMTQENYDYTLCFLPPDEHDMAAQILNQAHRTAVVIGPHSHPHDLERVRKLEQSLLNKKSETIWLSAGPDFSPMDFTPDMTVSWNMEWGRNLIETGHPFIPPEDRQRQRMMDRLARNFGKLLVGLAMGSGAAFGYSLIGILRVLEREGIYPDMVSGTSMGALIGSFYAAGKSPDELEDIATSITRKKLWQMADFTFPRSGIIKGKGVLNFLRSQLGDKTFKDLQIPFSCVATDIQTGKEIVLDEGNVAEAVRGSLSLPFFFHPYYLNGRYLVDGGLVNPVPTSIIIAQGANILLSANLTSKTSERRVPRVMGWRKKLPPILRGPSIPEILMKTIYTMQYEIAQARSIQADVVMQINASDLLWWDLDKAKDIIKIGESTAEECIPKIKSLLPFFADSCQVRLNPRNKKTY